MTPSAANDDSVLTSRWTIPLLLLVGRHLPLPPHYRTCWKHPVGIHHGCDIPINSIAQNGRTVSCPNWWPATHPPTHFTTNRCHPPLRGPQPNAPLDPTAASRPARRDASQSQTTPAQPDTNTGSSARRGGGARGTAHLVCVSVSKQQPGRLSHPPSAHVSHIHTATARMLCSRVTRTPSHPPPTKSRSQDVKKR